MNRRDVLKSMTAVAAFPVTILGKEIAEVPPKDFSHSFGLFGYSSSSCHHMVGEFFVEWCLHGAREYLISSIGECLKHGEIVFVYSRKSKLISVVKDRFVGLLNDQEYLDQVFLKIEAQDPDIIGFLPTREECRMVLPQEFAERLGYQSIPHMLLLS